MLISVSVLQVPQQTLNQALQNTIQTPNFPPKLPPTVVEMCNQYRVNGLQEFETANMTSWARKLKMLYRQGKYLNNKVKERAMRLNIGTIKRRMLRAAETMCKERFHLVRAQRDMLLILRNMILLSINANMVKKYFSLY